MKINLVLYSKKLRKASFWRNFLSKCAKTTLAFRHAWPWRLLIICQIRKLIHQFNFNVILEILQKFLVYDIFEIKIQFTKWNSWFSGKTEHFCDLQLISGYVYEVTLCSKLNLKFLFSGNLLQRHGFLRFVYIFWT